MHPVKMVNQIENGMSMRTLDGSACLSKIDDLEVLTKFHYLSVSSGGLVQFKLT